jgi:hypothetical protein
MASVANDPGGRRRILFVAPDGSRKTLRLGKVAQRAAEGVALRVEHLLQAKLIGEARRRRGGMRESRGGPRARARDVPRGQKPLPELALEHRKAGARGRRPFA